MGVKLNAKLNKHVAGLGAAAAAISGVGVAQQAQATIVYSGVVNINIPSTSAGIYLNVVSGVSGTAAAAPGWDVNPWSATGLGFFNPAAPSGGVYVSTGSAGFTANLALSVPIGAANSYSNGVSSNVAQWTAGSANLVGFRFQNEANGNQIHYGWMRLSLSSPVSAQPRSIVEYAYEDVAGGSIPAGVVPEPASLGLLALGAMGLVARRR